MNHSLDSRPAPAAYRHDERPVLTDGGLPDPAMASSSELHLAKIAQAIYEHAWCLDNRQLSVLAGFLEMHRD